MSRHPSDMERRTTISRIWEANSTADKQDQAKCVQDARQRLTTQSGAGSIFDTFKWKGIHGHMCRLCNRLIEIDALKHCHIKGVGDGDLLTQAKIWKSHCKYDKFVIFIKKLGDCQWLQNNLLYLKIVCNIWTILLWYWDITHTHWHTP
jgi:hypothetical protein